MNFHGQIVPFQESQFPTIIYNKPKDTETYGGEISDMQTMYTKMWGQELRTEEYSMSL